MSLTIENPNALLCLVPLKSLRVYRKTSREKKTYLLSPFTETVSDSADSGDKNKPGQHCGPLVPPSEFMHTAHTEVTTYKKKKKSSPASANPCYPVN